MSVDPARFAVLFVTFVPGLSLLAYWTFGEPALITMALVLPVAGSLWAAWPQRSGADAMHRHGALPTAEFHAQAKLMLARAREQGKKTAVFAIEIDDMDELRQRHGPRAFDDILEQTARRIQSHLRSSDIVGHFGDAGFYLCLEPQHRIDLETCLQVAGRIMAELDQPISVDRTTIYITASVGFCQNGRETARALSPLDDEFEKDPVTICAEVALHRARAAGPAAIRAFSTDMCRPEAVTQAHPDDPADALAAGEIIAWFQPQLCNDTGRVIGFEALARWMHPTRGPLPPSEFLQTLTDNGQLAMLSETMLYHALMALKSWDEADLDIDHVGVNFAQDELSDPGLIGQIRWQLDRFELTPNRLAIEILESVVSQGPEDVVTRNIRGLTELGCRIDLDDFGTGQASIGSIRRFGVSRIKIDRSFVTKVDRDPEQQRMIKAILTMAEKLEIETLAEGVETAGEHALLAQLGCTHAQGFGIARPMPFDQTVGWVRAHKAKLQTPPDIGKLTG